MRKVFARVVAGIILCATVLTELPAQNVFASSDYLPAAGGALATGEGISVSNIKANIARSQARKSAATTHSNINSAYVASTDADLGATGSDSPLKAETPASKAVAMNNGSLGGTTDAAPVAVAESEPSSADDQAETTPVDPNAAPSMEITIDGEEVADGEQDLSNTIIAQVNGYVNVRETASEESAIVGKLYNESAGTWLGKEGDWYKIKSGTCVGYVKGEYVVTGEAAIELAAKVGQRIAVVNTTTLKVREDASLEAPVLGLVGMEDTLSVIEETDEWCKVSIEEGDGWINKEFVILRTEFVQAESKAEEEARLKKEEEERKKANAAAQKASKKKGGTSNNAAAVATYGVSGSGYGASVANFALQFVGNPYVWGGTSLTNGADCSGFVMSVYRNFGVSLPHSSGAQRGCGYSVGGIGNAQPGDIVCYSGHVAIYIGNGMIVHASTAKTGIKVSECGYRPILDVRRIF